VSYPQQQPAPAPYQSPVQYTGQPASFFPAQQAAAPSCRMCGSVPAAKVTFRGHQGFVIVMRFLSIEGPFCRDCGLGTFRTMTSRTLVQGWWGYASFVITPIIVLLNLVRRGTVADLAAPRPNPHGPSRPPLHPGAPLMARPMTWAGLLILVSLVCFLVLVFTAG
jgi:hypothetical protein